MEPKFQLLKPRDFGELVNDTFVFARQNLKPLLKVFFTFCGIFLLASIIIGCLKQVQAVNMINSINTIDSENSRVFSSFSGSNITLGVLSSIASILFYVMMIVSILSYIALYREKGGVPPTPDEVWGYIKYYFLRTLGGGIVVGILLILGCVLCLIPGIYLYPILSLIIPLMIFENTSFGYAFNQSFRLIKDYWWRTFGAIFIVSLIIGIISFVVILPASIATGVGIFLHRTNSDHFSALSVITLTVLSQLCSVLSILHLITVALCYFSLTEIKEGTGLMDRMENFGTDDGPAGNLPTEEY